MKVLHSVVFMDVQKFQQQLQQDPNLRNRVARRAYELFIQRGRQMGREAEDWFQAENEILHRLVEEEKQQVAITEAAIKPQTASEEVCVVKATGSENLDTAQNKTEALPAKKRTYTRKKKVEIAETQEIKTANSNTLDSVPKTAPKQRARREKSKTSVAGTV